MSALKAPVPAPGDDRLYPGLPERLPADETMLWQGAPDWRSLALRAFHAGLVAAWFTGLAVWGFADALLEGRPLVEATGAVVGLVPAAMLGLGLIALLAWLTARATCYSLTSKRLVIRSGVALPVTINLPYSKVDAAAVKPHGDGTGDISLALAAEQKVGYLVLWPHARRWHLRHPQPTLRCIPQAGDVAALLAGALASAAQQPASLPVRVAAPRPAPADATGPAHGTAAAA
jgi:hypothetical protein